MNNPTGKCHCGCGQQTRIVSHTRAERGQRKGDFANYAKGHNDRPYRDGYVVIDAGYATTCWLWTGKIDRGYAVGLGAKEFSGRIMRLRWKKAHGPQPEGTHLHHLCNNKSCIRLDHLQLIASTEHPKLHRKIPNDVRLAIQLAEGTHRAIAKRFGVSKTHVTRLKRVPLGE